MFNFGKTKEELKVCKAALEKRLEELRRAGVRETDLKEKLDVSEGKVFKALAEIQSCYMSMDGLRKQAEAGEAYKKDNLTLISRVAQLQEEVANGHEQFRELDNRNTELQNTVQQLLDAVDRAKVRKSKKKKSGKKKRK